MKQMSFLWSFMPSSTLGVTFWENMILGNMGKKFIFFFYQIVLTSFKTKNKTRFHGPEPVKKNVIGISQLFFFLTSRCCQIKKVHVRVPIQSSNHRYNATNWISKCKRNSLFCI